MMVRMLKFLKDNIFTKRVWIEYIKICSGFCVCRHLSEEEQLIKSLLDNNTTDEVLDDFIQFQKHKTNKGENKQQRIRDYIENDVEAEISSDCLVNNKEYYFQVYKKIIKAKQYKLTKNYRECQTICEEILQKYPDNIYVKNLLITVLAQMGDLKTFTLIQEVLEKGFGTREDVKNTVYAILGEYSTYPQNFIETLAKYQRDILFNYYKTLGDANPKKEILREFIGEK